MGRNPSFLVALLVLALLAAVPFASAANPTATVDSSTVKSDSTSMLNGPPAFSGRVTAENSLCKAGRTVKVRQAGTGALLAKATTDSNGRWSKPRSFSGRATAKVLRKKIFGVGRDRDRDNTLICRADRSPVVSFGADLSLDKTFDGGGCDGAACVVAYEITVHNAGPDTAQNVTVLETPPNSGFSFGGDSENFCTDNGNGTQTCSLGNVAPGGTVSFGIGYFFNSSEFDNCPTPGLVNVATANSKTPDPNPKDNTDTLSICGGV